MINVAVLMGRLVADPELRHTPNDISVTTIRIAVDRRFNKAGGEKQTDFIDVTAWRQTAEFICRYFRKGSMIAVQGSIRVENYTDRDGNKRSRFEVVADNVSFCGEKRETSESAHQAYQRGNQEQPNIENDEEDPPQQMRMADGEGMQPIPPDDDLPF